MTITYEPTDGHEWRKMNYGIQALDRVIDTYDWMHPTLESAKNTAKELAERHRVDFIVFEIVGTFSNKTIWEEST